MKRLAAIFAACAALSLPLQAQPYPNKPVRLVSAFTPGGGSEIALRIIAQKLVESGWPSAVVDNRPGGGGVVAAMATKQSAPDGYTILQADMSAFAINVTLVPDLPYDPLKDFTPIMNLWSFPSVLVAATSLPSKTAAELIALAKTKPGGLNYASQGVGSGGHLLGTMFQNSLGTPMTHAPYKGSGQAMPDVAAGRVDYIFASLGSVRQFLEAGSVRPLAVTAKKRMAELPDVPTMTELGHPSVFLDLWFGLVGPAGMAPDVVRTVHDQVDKILRMPEVTKRLVELGLYVDTNAPDAFRAQIGSDIERLGKVVKDAKMKVE